MSRRRRRAGRATTRLAVAGVLVAALIPAGSAHAADIVGADNYRQAPLLLFSDSGTVADNVLYTAPSSDEPVAGCSATEQNMTRTAWWRFTGTGKPIRLTTLASDFDTVLAVYDAPAGVPIHGNQIACNNDAPGLRTSALTFPSDTAPSERGKNYLVQVGSNGLDHGRIGLSASAVRPANDDRTNAQVLQTGSASTVDNSGASQERGETLSCGTAPYAATMWFKWTAPALGDAVFSSTSQTGNTVVTVYPGSGGPALACNAGSLARVPLRVSAGTFIVQVGTLGADDKFLPVGPVTTKVDFTVDPDADNDGEPASTDCNDSNPSIRHGLTDIPDDGIDQNCDGVDAVNPDRDGDGENRPADRNDANPAIHHGAKDIPGNKIDEDCSGGDAPFPRLRSTVRSSWRFNPFHFTKLVILRPVAGSRVELRCKGRGCPFKRSRVKIRKSRATLSVESAKVNKARLKRGAVFEVRITKRGYVGFMRRHIIRGASRDPKIREFCLPPRAKESKRC